MKRRLVLGAALLLSACGGDEAVHRPPADAGTAIVVVERRQSLALPAEQWALPEFALFGDGTAVVRGEDRGVLLTGERRTLSAQQVAALFRRAADAGLFDRRRYPREVTDATTLTVRVTSTQGSYETTVVQPSPNDGGDRRRVIAFADAAARTGTGAGDYQPQRAVVLVLAGADDTSDVRPWPLPVPLSQLPGAPTRPCLVVEGDDLASLTELARSASDRTRWSAQGQRVSLLVRPLLPDERGCADLAR